MDNSWLKSCKTNKYNQSFEVDKEVKFDYENKVMTKSKKM